MVLHMEYVSTYFYEDTYGYLRSTLPGNVVASLVCLIVEALSKRLSRHLYCNLSGVTISNRLRQCVRGALF